MTMIKGELYKITEIVTGDVSGADSLVVEYTKQNKIPYIVYRALWDMYGNAAGPIRNEEMIKGNKNAKYLIAFSGGKGTNNAKIFGAQK